MKHANPAYIVGLKDLVDHSPYFSHLSMSMTDIGVGFSVFELVIHRYHWHPFDSVHGGVIASAIDSAAFWAMHFDLTDPAASLTSVDLKLNYLAPVASGKLVARGRRIKLGRTLGYAEADVKTESGKLISHGTSTLMVLNEAGSARDPSLPEKFLPD